MLYFLVNISISIQSNIKYDIIINIEQSEMDEIFINDKNTDSPCEKWIPSLFNPILIVPKTKDIIEGEDLGLSYRIKNPFLNNFYEFQVSLYKNTEFLNEKYLSFAFQAKSPTPVSNCYFGLSFGNGNYSFLTREQFNLNLIANTNKLKKIFSFDKWIIKNFLINTAFYFGDTHDIFNSNKGIVGNCRINQEDSFWGCSFKEMLFNNINVPLKDNNGNSYKIYFSSETHNIIFPLSYKENFEKISNNICKSNEDGYVTCKYLFNDKKYAPLTLTEENDEIIITGEVDSLNRFNGNNDYKNDFANIRFENINYIIIPLIVFKEFYIQFNAEENVVSFYTEDSKILKVKEKEKSGNNNSSSIGLTILLITLCIFIILALSFGIYLFIKKKSNNYEKDINKFNKYEDEEDFHNMNENRVF